jgi:hypothetical protein
MTTPRAMPLIDQIALPFGKYRGEPLAVLKDDLQYAVWLMKQKWVFERFPDLALLIGKLIVATNHERAPRHREAPSVSRQARTAAVGNSDKECEKHDARTLYYAKLLSEILTGGAVSLGACFVFLRINQIADDHDVLAGEREHALEGFGDLTEVDGDLLIDVTLALNEYSAHGFAALPTVADIKQRVAVAAQTQLVLDRLLGDAATPPEIRERIIIRRPVA